MSARAPTPIAITTHLAPPSNGKAAQGFRLAEDFVSAVAGAPVRTGKRSNRRLKSLGNSATPGALSKGASSLLDEIASTPLAPQGGPGAVGGRNLRGVFYHDSKTNSAQDGSEVSPMPSESRARAVDFRQRLDMLLASEDCARAVARKLYPRFEGDTARLPSLLQQLEEKWGFPERVFPLLWTHMQRATGYTSDLQHVEEEDWTEAFMRWLQVVRTRCERTKLSRQCFVQTQSGADSAKVYLQGAKLGEGSYGEVYMAFHKDLGVDRVVKSVSKAQLGMAEEQVQDEVNALKSLDHPHIVRIFEAFETEEKLHIVMDYAEGGDLAGAIRKAQDQSTTLPETWVRAVAGQITSALEYMHSKGMIHCDLKPGNTMLLRPFDLDEAKEGRNPPHTLLVDFGLAEIFEERSVGSGPTQVKGTPSYLAPEGFEGRVNHKSDMWALGVMIFEMILGYRPFKGTSNVFMLYGLVANTEPSLEGMPPLAQHLVKELMAKDPKLRPTAGECRQHGWFEEHIAAAQRPGQLPLPSGLTTLGHDSYFHRAVTFCIASALGMKDMQDLFEVFLAMDSDLSGYLSPEQLREGLASFGIQQDPGALMAILDLDGDGRISITEFLAGAMQLKEGASDKQIRYAFGLFDLDCDDHISMDELRLMLSGDGPLADVLPDGQTAEQIMEEVSGGVGRISFEDFRAYLTRARHLFPCRSVAGSIRADDVKEDTVAALVQDLDPGSRTGSKERVTFSTAESTVKPEFPTFHTWLVDLFEETQQSASFSSFLVYVDRKLEAAYVAHYIRSTCQQLFLLGFALVVYSIWSLTTEDWTWQPSIVVWELPPQTAFNLAWLILMASGLGVMLICFLTLWWQNSPSQQAKGDDVTDAEAVRLERILCGWACFVQWFGCFFANRFRLSALFGANAEDVFPTLNSDYDLIITMIGMLMFFSTRTHVRFICILPIAASCVLAYAITSTFLGVADSRCTEEKNWAWPAILLTVMTGLCLSGHRTVEYHRRLTFLSLYASYSVLRDVDADEEDAESSKITESAKELGPGSPGMRDSRIKRALDLIRRLGESGEPVSRPLRAALQSLAEVLQSTREDIAQVDRLMVIDVEAKLQQRGVAESSQDLLLPMFDALPSVERVFFRTKGMATLDLERSGADVGGWDASTDELEKNRPWGWETLLSTRMAESDTARPLAIAGSTLLVPAVAKAASRERSEATEAARAQARCLLEILLDEYARGPRSAEAQAALAVQSAHWIAHRVGLWQLLQAWERVALLVAALGLHCGAGAEKGGGSGTLIAKDPLLAHAASASRMLAALEKSGLGDAGVEQGSGALRVLLRRLLARSRPRCILEDTRRMRAHFEKDDQVPAAPAERAVLTSLVLAAADLSFLALPTTQHRPWALLCQEEAAEAALRDLAWIDDMHNLDVASWLRGLIEVLALPVYEVLGLLGGAEAHLAVPLRHLRENAKHWNHARLMVTPCGSQDVESNCPSSSATGIMSLRLGATPTSDLQSLRTPTAWEDKRRAGGQQNTLVATVVATLPVDQELGSMSYSRDISLSIAETIPPCTSAPGTIAFGTLPVGTLPPGSLPPGTLPPGTLPPGTLPPGTLPPGTLPPGTLPPGTLPPGTLPPGTLPPGTLPPGTLPGGASLAGTLAGGALGPDMMAEAREGDAPQPPMVPESTRSGHSVSMNMGPRAKLPGQVSPLSDNEDMEEESF